jgi:hypothetical protein
MGRILICIFLGALCACAWEGGTNLTIAFPSKCSGSELRDQELALLECFDQIVQQYGLVVVRRQTIPCVSAWAEYRKKGQGFSVSISTDLDQVSANFRQGNEWSDFSVAESAQEQMASSLTERGFVLVGDLRQGGCRSFRVYRQ